MYVWKQRNKRDRRDYYGRGFTQIGQKIVSTEILSNQQLQEQKKDDEKRKCYEERVRRHLEERHVKGRQLEMLKDLEAYLTKDLHGQAEVEAVAQELLAWKEANQIEHGGQGDTLQKKKQQALEVFEMFDADGSETIDKMEMQNLVQQLCIPMTEKELDKLFEEIDKDGTGEVDFEEFYDWYSQHHTNLARAGKAGALHMRKFAKAILGITLRLEAKRVILAHAEHESRERAIEEYRQTRPPQFVCEECQECFESQYKLQQHVLKGEEGHQEFEKLKAAADHRFEPVTRTLQGENGRRYQLQRLVYSQSLYVPRNPEEQQKGFRSWTNKAEPMLADPERRREVQQARGQAVEGIDPRFGKRPLFQTKGGFEDPQKDERRQGRLRLHEKSHDPSRLQEVLIRLLMQQKQYKANTVHLEEARCWRGLCEFRWPGFVQKAVQLSGEFNGWQLERMQMDPNQRGHYLPKELGAGVYQFWFCVDGKMMVDPGLPTFGEGESKRNVILVAHPTAETNVLAISPETDLEEESNSSSNKEGTALLENIDLSHCSICDDGACALASCLANDNSVSSLNLSYCNISSDGAFALAAALERNQRIHTIQLQNNGIGYVGAEKLGNVLSCTWWLRRLNLSSNCIGDDGVEALCQGIEGCGSLVWLNLDDNSIHCDGASAIGNCLMKNKSIITLLLRQNMIASMGAVHLSKGLTQNRYVKQLDLSKNPFKAEGAKALGEMLCLNNHLQELRIPYCDLVSQKMVHGVYHIAYALSKNTSLITLDMKSNNLTDYIAKELSRNLNNNKALVNLDLAFNEISDVWFVPGTIKDENSSVEYLSIASIIERNTTLFKSGEKVLKSKNLIHQRSKSFDQSITSSLVGFVGARREYEQKLGEDAMVKERVEGHWSVGGHWVDRDKEERRAIRKKKRRLIQEETTRRHEEDEHLHQKLKEQRLKQTFFYDEPDGKRLISVLGNTLRKLRYEQVLQAFEPYSSQEMEPILSEALKVFDIGCTGFIERHDIPALLEEVCVPSTTERELHAILEDLHEKPGDKGRQDMKDPISVKKFTKWYSEKGKKIKEANSGQVRSLKVKRTVNRKGLFYAEMAKRILESMDRHEIAEHELEIFRESKPPNIHCEVCLKPYALPKHLMRHEKKDNCSLQIQKERRAYRRDFPMVQEARRAVFGLPTLPAYFCFAEDLRDDDELQVYQEPDPTSHPVGILTKKDCVRGTKFQNNWLCISFKNKDEAWVKFRIDKKADKALAERRKKEKDDLLKEELDLAPRETLMAQFVRGIKSAPSQAVKNLSSKHRKGKKLARKTMPDKDGYYLRPMPLKLAEKKSPKKKLQQSKTEDKESLAEIKSPKDKGSKPKDQSLAETETADATVLDTVDENAVETFSLADEKDGGKDTSSEVIEIQPDPLRTSFQTEDTIHHFKKPRIFRPSPDLSPSIQLKVRTKPYAKADVIGFLTSGQGIIGYSMCGDWLQIWYNEYRACWILNNFHGRTLLERIVDKRVVREALERHRSPFTVPRHVDDNQVEPFIVDKETNQITLKKYVNPPKHPPTWYY